MSNAERALRAAMHTVPAKEQPISEQFRIVAKQWCDADAAASLMEELKTTTLEKMKSDLIERNGPTPDNTATRLAKCNSEWTDYLAQMCKHRAEANRLKCQMEYIRMRHREWIGADATARAEMKL
jgi:hypothetical protein